MIDPRSQETEKKKYASGGATLVKFSFRFQPGYLFHIWILILFLGVFSCSTLKPPVNAGASLTSESIDRDIALTITLTDRPDFEKLINDALKACQDQDWNRAVDLLIEGDNLSRSPEIPRTIFRSLLEKMTDQPFPSGRVFEYLARTTPVEEAAEKERLRVLGELATSSPRTLEWSDSKAVLAWLPPKGFSLGGLIGLSMKFHPVVEVMVNGSPMRMILDTGAETTALYADAAQRAGIKPLAGLDLTVESSNDLSSQGKIGVIKSEVMGNLQVLNDRVLIVPRPFGVDFDGVVGWPVLSQLVMEMDAAQQKIILRPSKVERSGPVNFYWAGDPIVVLQAGLPPKQIPFSLDTGAARTWFSPEGLNRLGIQADKMGQAPSGGVAGVQWKDRNTFKRAEVFLDGRSLVFLEHVNSPNSFHFFNFWNGVLGSDLAQAGVITFDFPSGLVRFEPFELEPIPRP